MYNFTEEQITKAYEKVPENVQEVLVSPQAALDLESIGKKHSIRVDGIQKLIDLTTFVILGLVPISDFVSGLEDSLDLDRQKALDIASDVDRFLFQKIRNKILEKEEEEDLKIQSDTEGQFQPDFKDNGPKKDILDKVKQEDINDEKIEKKLSSVQTSSLKEKINNDPYRESI